MYDFANSGYTTVVITAVFNAYFVAAVAGKAPWATFAWTAALSVSYLAVLLSAPVVGAWADAHAAKKRLLFLATAGCVVFTGLLYFVSPGAVALAICLVILSNFFFATGENLIAAFLPELADSRAMGRVSGWGWAFGYLGGLVSLGISLSYILISERNGQTAAQFVPVTMLITAVVFALCATPTFLFLRERARPQPSTGSAWARVLETVHHAREFADLRRFLVCILFYQAGIMAVIALAAIYAQEAMKFTSTQTIVLVLVVNVTAAIGAFCFGYLQDAIGHIRSMALVLAGWIVMIALAYLAEGAQMFWAAANLAGLCMGAAQAAGRAIVGYLCPPERNAEFFGLWGLAVKAASIFGPLTYGAVTWIFPGDHRLGILSVGTYFVAGLVLLTGIDVERGRRAALQSMAAPEILFVYGLSATGKTTLGKYLEKEKGWLFIEVDTYPQVNGDGIDAFGLRGPWDRFLHTGDALPLIAELSSRAKRLGAPGVVVGFPSRLELDKRKLAALENRITVVYLVGEEQYCRREFHAREARAPRGLAADHWEINNREIADHLRDPELKRDQVDVFTDDGTRIAIDSVWRQVEARLVKRQAVKEAP
jgi:UMF1 family MFS transporter